MIKDLSKLCFLPGSLLALKDGKYNYISLLKQGLTNLGVAYPSVGSSVDLPLVSVGGVISMPQADVDNDGYLSAADWAAFNGTISWTTSSNDIVNSNVGNVGIGGAPIGSHKFDVVGGIKSSANCQFNGIEIGKGVNNNGFNTVIGTSAMTAGTTTNSTLVGYLCGNILTGINCTGLGMAALANATNAAGAVAIGWQAMRYRTGGFYNVAVGYESMGTGIGTGAGNTALGRATLKVITSGVNNIAIGYQAGLTLLDGSTNIFIGANVDGSTTSISNELNIGNWIKGTNGQISVGGALPASCAIFDAASTTKGLLLPRMTKVQRDAIASPVAGLYIHQTDNTPGLRGYNGTNWVRYTETVD